jgi:hypothetical protein
LLELLLLIPARFRSLSCPVQLLARSVPVALQLPRLALVARKLPQPHSTTMARSQELTHLFQQPTSTAQRHYEICRAYFVDHASAADLAQRFHLHVGSIRAVVRDFAGNPDLGHFFRTAEPRNRAAPKRAAIRDRACDLRRQGHTLADIRTQLHAEGHLVSKAYLFRLLQGEGLATKGQRCRPLPQFGDHAKDGSLVPAVADVRQFVLTNGRQFPTKNPSKNYSVFFGRGRIV